MSEPHVLESATDRRAYRELFYRVFKKNFVEAPERYRRLAEGHATQKTSGVQYVGIKKGAEIIAGGTITIGSRMAYLADLAVDPLYIDLGLAKKLIAKRIALAHEARCERVITEIRSSNYAALNSVLQSGLKITAVGEIEGIAEPIFIPTLDLLEQDENRDEEKRVVSFSDMATIETLVTEGWVGVEIQKPTETNQAPNLVLER